MLNPEGPHPSLADVLRARLARETSLLLAVSGGPDSVALMLLAARWTPPTPRMEVATVDHGLRDGSREEAERTGEWARALGFRHHLLTWEGAKPRSRVQERAREARYALLGACARKIGDDCAVVTAHHADDQAETVLFRLTRGSGVAGLSGMAPEAKMAGVRLLRPLLDCSKAELEAVRRDAGHPCFVDPSNENEIFARARLRGLSATLAAQGLDRQALLRLGARAFRAEEALRFAAARLRREAESLSAGNAARFDGAVLRDAPLELLQRVIGAEISRLAPSTQFRLERLERATSLVAAALRGGAPARLTLAGALLSADVRGLTLRPAPLRRLEKAAAKGVKRGESVGPGED